MNASSRQTGEGGWPRWFHLPAFGRSVRAQLVLWNVLTLAAMFGVIGLFARYTVRARLMASVDRELALRMRSHRLPPPPGQGGHDRRPIGPPGPGERRRFLQGEPQGRAPGPPPILPPLPEEAIEAGVILLPRLMDAQGHVIGPPGATQPWDKSALTRAMGRQDIYSTVHVEGVKVRVMTRALPPFGPVDRVIQMPYPLTDVERAISGMNWTFLAFIPLVLFLAGWGGSLLTDRALRPVQRIALATGRISAQDLSERLPVLGEDEFARLSMTVNGMLERLELAFEEQRRLVDALRRMVDQQRRFTADASHELRTPLTVIKANTSLALSGAPLPEDLRPSMEDIDRATDAASRLVYDLLLLARSDAGQLGRDAVTLPIRGVLERAAASVPRDGGPPVWIEVSDAALCVKGNEDELVRVFTNLLENARRYTPANGQITLRAQRMDRSVRAQVVDTGVGIAPEHIPHLGERFYRVDPARSRQEGGSGLGLSICRGIVEAHGGKMQFQSAPGQGTTVSVTLPVAEA